MTEPETIFKGHKKGVKHKRNGILTGLIEPVVDDEWEEKVITGIEDMFIVKRQIGGTAVNGRKIKGWKEVPIVKDWTSTYRHSEWADNFQELTELFKEKDLGGILKSGDLTQKEKEFNHALTVFINSFLTKDVKHKDGRNENPLDILEAFKIDGIIQNHAEDIYLNKDYGTVENGIHKSDKICKVKINDKERKLRYGKFRLLTYGNIVEIFFDYMNRMEDTTVTNVYLAGEGVLEIDVKHRWKDEYAKVMLAKFKDLEDSRFTDMWTTMLTITTYQDNEEGNPETPEDWEKGRGASWFEAMERMKESLDKTLDVLRQIARRELETKFHYVWIVEAHKSGYPHIHIAIFGDVSEWLDKHENKLRIQKILEEKHDIGKSGIATEFDTKPPSGEGAIDNLSNYLMKYFKKNFGELQSKYESNTLEEKDWGTIVYNACMFVSGYRTWGTSKEVGEVMKSDSSKSNKEYKNLGGELNSSGTKDFKSEVNSKGDEELKKRVENRELFRKALKDRKDIVELTSGCD